MAAKRKTKTSKQKETMGPSKWRLQHGCFSEPLRAADPETGSPVAHRRAVDTLGMMLANGTITPEMHDAGERFRILFRAASLDGLRASQLLRVPGGSGDPLTERQASSRARLAAALDALGGHGSAAGSCAWHILGLEASVREWAMRQGWGGRPVAPPQAQGMLVATLGVLAAHFRMGPRLRAA
ncbi:MAG: hypothetical protein EBY30_15425 [Rhodospirillales bacterium]|nr:hypothetical protein [Rhodospirillales bacterium]